MSITKNEYIKIVGALPLQTLTKWAWKYTKDLQGSEDVAQEVYERLLHVDDADLAELADADAVHKLAHVLVRNVGVDSYRRKRRELHRMCAGDPQDQGAETHNPERILIARENLRMLSKALQGMPPKRRRVVKLTRLFGYPAREVARKLKITEATVKVHMRDATKACAAALEEKDVTEGTRLLGRLLRHIGMGKGPRSTRRRKLIEPKE